MSTLLRVGQVESIKRVFSQLDFNRFAALSGDDNPIHVDPEFSARTRFGRTVAHGMFLYSAVCSVLSARLPGPGMVQLEQELMFPSPTYVGEQITIRVEVTQLQSDEGLVDLATTVVKPDANLGLQGRTLVHLPDLPDQTSLLGVLKDTELAGVRPSTNVGDLAEAVAFKGLEVGQQAETRRTFTAEDIAEYADLTSDANPIFVDADYARRLGLPGPMIPGPLFGGLFSCLLGTRLPGRGTGWLKQKLCFPTPAYLNEEITARVEIIRLRPEKALVNLRTVCTNPAGIVVCEGESLVLVKDLEVSE